MLQTSILLIYVSTSWATIICQPCTFNERKVLFDIVTSMDANTDNEVFFVPIQLEHILEIESEYLKSLEEVQVVDSDTL
jgi:hypothetical protein